MATSPKNMLINTIASEANITKTEAANMLTIVASAIKQTVEADNTVRLAPLGSFSLKHRAARTARNPRTGESVDVPARDVIVFKASKGK